MYIAVHKIMLTSYSSALLHTEITTAPGNVLGVPRDISPLTSSLLVQWSLIEGAEGYIVMATAFNTSDDQLTVTEIVLMSQEPTISNQAKIILTFNITCVSYFTYKVAGFNSGSKGEFSKVENTQVSNVCVPVTEPNGEWVCIYCV